MTDEEESAVRKLRAVINLDVQWMAEFLLPMVPSDPRIYLVALHKIRCVYPAVPQELRTESVAWLVARGYIALR